MDSADKVFAGKIPEIYDRFFVPLIFEAPAKDVAERIAALKPRSMLEIAAGTGVLTRALAAQLGPEARIIATDLNQAMIDQAGTHAADARIAWQVADGQSLPFDDETFDLVACQFGVMFFPDQVRGFSEARRVLRPGGRYVFSVWDRIETNEFADAVTQALELCFPADPPRFMARTPHGHFDTDRLGSGLEAAGLRDVSFETMPYMSYGPSAEWVAVAYCQGTVFRTEIETRAPGSLGDVTEAVTKALEARFGTGPVEGRIQAIVATATR